MAERTLTLLLAMPDVDEPLDPAPLRAAAAVQGGTPEPTEAAGHLFSFPSAVAAVQCAVVAQRAGARWRIGIHSGDVARLEHAHDALDEPRAAHAAGENDDLHALTRSATVSTSF